MKRSLFSAGFLACLLSAGVTLMAQGPKGFSGTPEEFEAKLGYQTGTVALIGGTATLHLPESFLEL